MSWTFERERCALIVVDMQNYFVLEGAPLECPDARMQIPLIQAIISKCRELGVPIIYTLHEPDPACCPLEAGMTPWIMEFGALAGTEEAKVVDELTPESGDILVSKRRFSAFYQTELELILRNLKKDEQPVDTLIICGTLANVCCESTVRDAYFRDFKVVFGTDINAAMTPEALNATIDNMYFFGRAMDCASIISALEAGRG